MKKLQRYVANSISMVALWFILGNILNVFLKALGKVNGQDKHFLENFAHNEDNDDDYGDDDDGDDDDDGMMMMMMKVMVMMMVMMMVMA